MPLNLRTYHELAGADRSGLPEQIAAQRRRVTERLATEFEVRPTLTALDLPHEPGPTGDGGGARFTYTVSSLTCT